MVYDLSLIFDNNLQYADISLITECDAIESAIIAALFTDKVADASYTGSDKRGWWCRNVGSRLWQLDYMAADEATFISRGEQYIKDALSYLVTDNVVKQVDVTCTFQSGLLTGNITITELDTTKTEYSYVFNG